MSQSRQPTAPDLIALVQLLEKFDVQYVVIGGAAMALHGLPRMTKDIDLLLPVNAENNERLLQALQALPENQAGIDGLRLEWMNKGHSTALEGDITIDLLYVAASQSFETLSGHIKTVKFAGTAVVTLDIDGMILSKTTTRASDLEDRLKLGRLKNALRASLDKLDGDS
jgi:Nucleotidyl transferase AbiEii toxin, Type IV TA system